MVFVSAALAQLSSAGVALALFLADWGVGLGWLGSELFLSSFLTLGAVIAVSIESAGVLLVFSSLVLPPVTGVLMGRSFRGVLFWSAGSGVAAAAGFLLSIRFDLPTGPAIVATSGFLLALAWWNGGLLRRVAT